MAISKPSKSAKKREYLALQALGEQLIGLTDEQLAGVALDESLRDAVIAAKSITSHGALKRQKQLIGKLMRHEDPAPIHEALLAFGKNDRNENKVFRSAESWRDRFANETPPPLAEYFTETGSENANLSPLCQSLANAHDDKRRREIRRKIFREIHHDLTAKMHTDSI